MPLDLLDRILIIKLLPYAKEDIQNILKIRAQVEGIVTEDDALDALADIGVRTTLRYAVQLLTPSNLLAKIAGRETVTKDDIEEIAELFKDAKASARILMAGGDKYLR